MEEGQGALSGKRKRKKGNATLTYYSEHKEAMPLRVAAYLPFTEQVKKHCTVQLGVAVI